jgi:3-hydroxyisobutyrate dehydrogenase-like beta-hydroxyacid dehydrogenase
MIAINQALDQIPPAAFYADFSTSSATVKRALATVAATRSIPFIDVALMGTVPGKGLRTPALASGPGAGHFVELFTGMGMPVVKVSDVPGDAATRKLLRSIVMKGMAGAIIEAMRGAEKAGCADWLWDNLAAEISRADAALLSRLVRGTELHAERRKHEMEASMNLLIDLGIEPLMTRSTIENLRRIPDEGMPAIPVLPD